MIITNSIDFYTYMTNKVLFVRTFLNQQALNSRIRLLLFSRIIIIHYQFVATDLIPKS